MHEQLGLEAIVLYKDEYRDNILLFGTEDREGNIWLTSNNTLHNCNSLLYSDAGINGYNIFDLARLSETLLLAGKVKALSGYDFQDNRLFRRLQDERILEVIERKDYAEVQHQAYTIAEANHYSRDFLETSEIARIMSATLPIRYDMAVEALSDSGGAERLLASNEWLFSSIGQETTQEQESLKEKRSSIDLYDRKYIDTSVRFNTSSTHDLINQIYFRSIVYYLAASTLGLSYSPDSLRIPITTYLNNRLRKSINKLGQTVIDKAELDAEEVSGAVNAFFGASSKFEMKVPACSTMILAMTKKPENFVDRALELRDTGTFKRARAWLSEADQAFRANDKAKCIKIMKDYRQSIENEDITKESLFVETIPELSINTAFQPAIGAPMAGLIQYLMIWARKRRFVFIENLNDHLERVMSLNNVLNSVFGKSLSEKETEQFRLLAKYQNEYLKP